MLGGRFPALPPIDRHWLYGGSLLLSCNMNGQETDIQQVADTVSMIESTIGKRLMELYKRHGLSGVWSIT